jgi:hypothetical protein
MTISSLTRDTLLALGFERRGDVLRAPAGSSVTLTLTDQLYYKLAITLPAGDVVSCVVPAVALNIEGAKP